MKPVNPLYCGRKGTRNTDLLCVREIHGLSAVSMGYIWLCNLNDIATFGDSFVQYVHIFHTKLLGLQLVAAVIKQRGQV